MRRRKRKVSELVRQYMEQHTYCEACGGRVEPWAEPHHIKSQGSGGGDEPDNLLRLCGQCHHFIHQRGPVLFVETYDHLYRKVTRHKPQVAVLLNRGGM